MIWILPPRAPSEPVPLNFVFLVLTSQSISAQPTLPKFASYIHSRYYLLGTQGLPVSVDEVDGSNAGTVHSMITQYEGPV
jgi:hypothetical protein